MSVQEFKGATQCMPVLTGKDAVKHGNRPLINQLLMNRQKKACRYNCGVDFIHWVRPNCWQLEIWCVKNKAVVENRFGIVMPCKAILSIGKFDCLPYIKSPVKWDLMFKQQHYYSIQKGLLTQIGAGILAVYLSKIG